jgi:hypothetical protein
MALEPITRQEKIIAGQDLTPITRMEMFLKEYGGSGGSGGGGGGGAVTTLHINITAVNMETMEATFTADKTPAEMQQASVNGPIWCVVTFAAGILSEEALSLGIPPAWDSINAVAFGRVTRPAHNENGDNDITFAVIGGPDYGWDIDLTAFSGS